MSSKGLYRANVVKGVLDVIIYDKIRLDNRPDCSIIKKRLLYAKCNVTNNKTEFDIAMGPVAYNSSLEFGAHDQLAPLIKLYMSQGVKEAIGYSLSDFLSLSDAETSIILDASKKRMQDKERAMENATKGFDVSKIGEGFE